MKLWQYLAAIAVLLAAFDFALAVTCPVSTCSPDDPNLPGMWLYSASMASYVHGVKFTVYPLKSDRSAFSDANATIAITAIQELQSFSSGCDKDTLLPEDSFLEGKVLREVDWSQMCCDLLISWDMVAPNINRTTASVYVSDPLLPDFKFFVNFSLVNESVSFHREGNPYTYNHDYEVEYSKHSAKMTMELVNWPWVAPSLTNSSARPSYLKFFMLGSGVLEKKGTVLMWDKGSSAFYNASTDQSYLELNFLKIFTVDDTDYAIASERGFDGSLPMSFESPFITAPFIVACCHGSSLLPQPYWQNFSYDPSMAALFSGEDIMTPPSLVDPKKRLNPAAYVVPIVMIIVILTIAGVLIMYPGARSILPGTSKRSGGRVPVFADEGPLPTHTDSMLTTDTRNTTSNWVRSTKQVQ